MLQAHPPATDAARFHRQSSVCATISPIRPEDAAPIANGVTLKHFATRGGTNFPPGTRSLETDINYAQDPLGTVCADCSEVMVWPG